MMLQFCQHDQVTRSDVRITPAISHEVYTLGGIACKNNLLALASIDKASYFYTSLFHPCRCLFADLINSTMYIGMSSFVIGTHGLDHSYRFLRTRRAVKINYRLPMYLPAH